MEFVIAEIIQLRLEGRPLTRAQEVMLQEWLVASLDNKQAFEALHDTAYLHHALQKLASYSDSEAKNWELIKGQLTSQSHLTIMPARQAPSGNKYFYHFKRYGWVAAVLFLIVGSVLYATLYRNTPLTSQESTLLAQVPTGTTGAILTLADGRQIVLDSLANGAIATQNGSDVLLNSGQLAYNASALSGDDVTYNTMTTPNGRQFSVVLPDGSTVWLNAASSITFPTAFTKKERRVSITGEVYFEIKPNVQKPFFVDVANVSEVRVLGTHFNINAYNNETVIKTTLLEGSVQVSRKGARQQSGGTHQNTLGVVLRPGEQAGIQLNNHAAPVVQKVNPNKVMAWKNDFFNFDNITFSEAMRQLERWYNIKVVYDNGTPKINLFGEISRSLSLQEVLHILAGVELKFKMEEAGKLIIYNN